MNNTKRKILLIDDDRDFLKILTLKLRAMFPGHELIQAHSVREGREGYRYSEGEIELVILDHHLPDGIGLDLLKELESQKFAALAVSSDANPSFPGESIKAGAMFFLSKLQISSPLFEPLVRGLIDRNLVMRDLQAAKQKETILETVTTLVGTLKHEINNPLGAVLGAAYILRSAKTDDPDFIEASRLVEESGKRIKHVLDRLSETMNLEVVLKSKSKVFHVPGDKPWESSSD